MRKSKLKELAVMTNSIVVARDMQRRQLAGAKMAADWTAELDRAIERLRSAFPVEILYGEGK